MNDSAEYFESLELHAGESDAPELPDAHTAESDFAQHPRPDAENLQLVEGLEAMLHGDSLEHVVAEVGAACVTRSDVASAVHTAVTDAVQAAVSGVMAVAVAAAVKANSSMNAGEVEKRFRQKYLGLGLPDVPGVDTPFLKAPRLQVEQDGSIALSPDEAMAVVELADNDTALDSSAVLAAQAVVEQAFEEQVFEERALEEQSGEQSFDKPVVAEQLAEEGESITEDTEEALASEMPEMAEMPEMIEPKQVVVSELIEVEPAAVLVDPVVQPEAVVESVVLLEPPMVPPESLTQAAEPLAEQAAVPELRPAMPDSARAPESVERTLRDEKSIQFVGFQVGTQMYAVPSILIREVIRRQPLSRLPVQTRYAPGVINLRGQVIPVVSLRELLQADMPPEGSRNQFSIITGLENLRIALEVDKIRSMYVVQQEDIVWNVASVLGLDDDTIIGLFELEGRLVPILSVERVAAILLEEGIDMEAVSA